MHSVIVLDECFLFSFVRFRFCIGAVTVALLIAIILPAAKTGQAQIINWTNTTGTPNPWYHADSNWVGGIAPGSNETARFNQATTYEIWWDNTTVSTTPDVEFLNLLDGDVTFLNNNSGGVQYEFTILGSGVAGSFSDFSISGISTALTNRGLHLRSLGGTQIIGGGTLTLDGSHAQGAKLSVDGSVGFQVDGSLNVEAGGLASNTLGFVGLSPGSTGVATVTGSESQWNNSNALYVALFGNGTLNVEAEGVVSNATGYLGYFPGSTAAATVTGSGSRWNNSSGLFLGGTDTINGGTGDLSLLDSGRVNVGQEDGMYTGSLAALTVSDSGSNGNLFVRNGSTITNSGYGFIGYSSGSTGVATVTGSGSQWNNSDNLYVGGGGGNGNGTLNVEAGGVVSSDGGFIGYRTDSAGVATVTGSGSQWNNSSSYVGYDGNGTLYIEAGGVISNTFRGYIGSNFGSTGVATVTGSGSQWNSSDDLYVGFRGNGALMVEEGGLINSNAHGYIGYRSGSAGVATVSGSGSQWNSSSFLFVGDSGNGTLNVEAGGVVSTFGGYIGNRGSSTGVATVTGSGSQWNNSSFLQVGLSGNGTLNVKAGGVVSNTVSYIGNGFGSTGVATVTGSGSQWNNSSSLYVGNNGNGNGTLNVEAGGVVSSDGGFIGNKTDSAGVATVTGSGSQWNNSNSLYIGGRISWAGGNGTLNVQDSGLVSVANTLKIWGPGTLNLDGGPFGRGHLIR